MFTLRCVTWCSQAVLPGGFVVVQREQHDVHGEDEHPGQEQVEDQVEEQDQTCEGGRGEGELSFRRVYHILSSPSPPPSSVSSL